MGHALRSLTLTRGATTFSKLGVQCLGVGYCTEQNADGIPSFMHCSLLRNGNHTLHQKVGVVRLNLGGGGPDPHRPHMVAPLTLSLVSSPTLTHSSRCTLSDV